MPRSEAWVWLSCISHRWARAAVTSKKGRSFIGVSLLLTRRQRLAGLARRSDELRSDWCGHADEFGDAIAAGYPDVACGVDRHRGETGHAVDRIARSGGNRVAGLLSERASLGLHAANDTQRRPLGIGGEYV